MEQYRSFLEIWCYLIVVGILVDSGQCRDGDVRLVGSPRSIEGRVEVENQGSWGGVCSNGWSHADATVVCRQLGYTNGAMLAGRTERLGFDPGTGPLILTGLGCTGTEARLSQCPGYRIHTNLTRDTCGDAAIVCQLPEYLGCFSGINDAWKSPIVLVFEEPTIDKCLRECSDIEEDPFQYARLSGGSICQCSNTPNFGSRVTDDRCSTLCLGSPSQACGGTFDERIYSYYPTSLGSSTGSYTTSSGTIVSPNFPGFYKSEEDGTWTITVSSARTLRFTFDFLDLFAADFVEIESGTTLVRIEHDARELQYTLQGRQFEVRFSVDANSDETNAGFLLRYTDQGEGTTARPRETTTQDRTMPPSSDCLKVGSTFSAVVDADAAIPRDRNLFHNQTFRCNAVLTSVSVHINSNQSQSSSFDVSVWRDVSGVLRRIQSNTLSLRNTNPDSPEEYDLDDSEDPLRVRIGDWISLDIGVSPFRSRPAAGDTPSATPFIALGDPSIEGRGIPDFEQMLADGNTAAFLVSVELTFRDRGSCDPDSVPHAEPRVPVDGAILEGESVEFVCDQYYHLTGSSDSTVTCERDGTILETFQCSRVCPNFIGGRLTGRVRDESAAVLIHVEEPFSCRGSVEAVTFSAEPRKAFRLSTWELKEDGLTFELYDSVDVAPTGTGGMVTVLEGVLLPRALRFLEGHFLGISYTVNNSIALVPQDSTEDIELSEYRIWNATSAGTLSIDDSTPVQLVPSIQLRLQSAAQCLLEDLPPQGEVNSSSADVRGYIPDGFVQAGDEIVFTCQSGFETREGRLVCTENGTLNTTPDCIDIDPGISPTAIRTILIMAIIFVSVGLVGVLILAIYYLCTIPEPRKHSTDDVEEYILNRNRRTSDDIPDSLPGDSDDEDYPGAVNNQYSESPEAVIPVPYDPTSDTFDDRHPPPRQDDDDRGSPVSSVFQEGGQYPSLASDPPPPPAEVPSPPPPPPPPLPDSPAPHSDSPSPATEAPLAEDLPPPPESPPPTGDGIPLLPIRRDEPDIPDPPAN